MSETTENIYKKLPLGMKKEGIPYKAIIVDDSRVARVALKQILLSLQFDVIEEFENGKAAVDKLKNPDWKIEYLFCDLEMPVMSGFEVVKALRDIHPKCKFIMVTSRSDKEIVEELIKSGINAFIKKPYDRDTVIARLTKLQSK